jgi:hypothetical protein
MKAITTKYVGPTNTKPARIIASDSDGNSHTYVPTDYPADPPHDHPHRAAALALCEKMRWTGGATLIEGGIRGGRVFVFPQVPYSPTPHARVLLSRALPLLIRLGDFIGNGPIDPTRAESLGERCDLIGDIHHWLERGE